MIKHQYSGYSGSKQRGRKTASNVHQSAQNCIDIQEQDSLTEIPIEEHINNCKNLDIKDAQPNDIRVEMSKYAHFAE